MRPSATTRGKENSIPLDRNTIIIYLTVTAEQRIKACLKINRRQIYLDWINESCRADFFFFSLSLSVASSLFPALPRFLFPLLICFDAQALGGRGGVGCCPGVWGGVLKVPQESKSCKELQLFKGRKVRRFHQRKHVQWPVLAPTITNNRVIGGDKKNETKRGTVPVRRLRPHRC